jgi:hypothetical protein
MTSVSSGVFAVVFSAVFSVAFATVLPAEAAIETC